MSILGTPEFKVGVLVVVVATLIGAMSLKVAEGPGLFGGSKTHSFVVDDAGGLVKNSAVKMAGIKVGIIKDIELIGKRAKVIIELDNDVELTKSSKIELRSDGILGDRHVEVVPGSETDEKLADGEEIKNADGSGGLNQVMAEVSKITKSLNELADNLNKAAKGDGDSTTPIGRIVLNIEKITKDLAHMTDRNKGKIDNIIDDVEALTNNLNNYIDEESLARVDKSIQNIEEITDKINKGEGTLGRLINDEETIEELNSAITNVNQFLGGATMMETSIDFHSEFLAKESVTKSYLGIRIQPGVDRYYEVQVIDDPLGVKSSDFTTVTDENGNVSTQDKTVVFKNKIKLTILFAKNFYDFTIKGGLIENAGGFGLDYYLMDRKLRASVEFFDFDELYARAFLRYSFFKGIYVVAGGDNLFSNGDTDFSTMVGAGLFLTNDDLKMLASKVSF